MGLMKQARGLPKFVMECGWWRHPAWIGAPVAAIAVQSCAISYAYEHETDGRLPGPVDVLATALGLAAKDVRAGVRWLAAHDRWLELDGGWEIAGYLDHNPSAAEVREQREARSKQARKAADARWSNTEHAGSNAGSMPSAMPAGNARGEERRGEELPGPPAASDGDALALAIAEACGLEQPLTPAATAEVRTAAAGIRLAKGTPSDVPTRARAYRARYPTAALTPSALAKHWPSLGSSNGSGPCRDCHGTGQAMVAGEAIRCDHRGNVRDAKRAAGYPT